MDTWPNPDYLYIMQEPSIAPGSYPELKLQQLRQLDTQVQYSWIPSGIMDTMAREELPQKVVNLIVDFFIGTRKPDLRFLAPISLISKTWNHAVLRRLYKKYTVKNDPAQIARFLRLFTNSRRRSHLTALTYLSSTTIVRRLNHYITRDCFGDFNQFLTAVNQLFRHDGRVGLALHIESEMRGYMAFGPFYLNLKNTVFVNFDDGPMLPTVPVVTELSLTRNQNRGLVMAPNFAATIVRSFPNLEKLEWTTGAPALCFDAERKPHWAGTSSPFS